MDLLKLRQLQNNAQEEIDENNNRNNREGLPLLYPVDNGTFRIKILYNEKANLIQRKIVRHTVGKNKIPCLSMYDEECPICKEIRNAQDTIGKDCGAFQKYGYKVRGISYGVLMAHDKGMFNQNNSPKIGDVVLFMYPISLYNQINELIVKSGENIESVFAYNKGKTIEITRSQNGNGPIEYKANVYAFGDESVRNTDEEFEELMKGIPSLSEAIVPGHLSEQDLQKVKAAAETVSAEYISEKVINPNNKSSAKPNESEKDNGQSLAGAMNPPEDNNQSKEESSGDNSDKPDCFGKHDDNNTKCLACPFEVDCLVV